MPHSKRNAASLLSAMTVLAFVAILMTPIPAAADHVCVTEDPCRQEFHGFNEYGSRYYRDIIDWSPTIRDEVGRNSWFSAYARNTGRYDPDREPNYMYTYANGGNDELDNHAYWDFTEAQQDDERPRGIFRLYMRIPESSTATVRATATVYYNVFIREDGADRLATSFVINQRNAGGIEINGSKGWVDSGRDLILKSPERVRVTISDTAAWPDFTQAGKRNAVIAVDAARLSHRGFLPEDRSYAQLQCTAQQDIAPSGLLTMAQSAEWSVYGSAAISLGGVVIGLTPAVSLVGGAVIGTSIALADPLSQWINGQTLGGAIDEFISARDRHDAIAFLNATTWGGKWYRSDKFDVPSLSWKRRWYLGGDPGGCQLLRTWERYLPDGA